MSGVRIYDLAKELGVTNGELIDNLRGLGVAAKSPSASITDSEADMARSQIKKGGPATAVQPPTETKASASASPSTSNGHSASSAPRPSESPAKPAAAPAGDTSAKVVKIPEVVSLKDFADLISVPASDIQKKLMGLGVLASLNQKLSPAVVTRLAKSYGVLVEIATPPVVEEKAAEPVRAKVQVVAPKPRAKAAGPVSRPPVVTIMGHVDHGKTTLLDTIRKSRVADGEFGGITQRVGAYQVDVPDVENPGNTRKVTFLDTPGHEAFTAMRARGAQVTDIAVLVVAADDGVMPQTIEAINHANAAGVPIIVAVNKIDKEDANPTRVLTQLTEYGVMPEMYGGSVQTVEVSAKENLGLDDLLEKILLVADAEIEPKADPTAPATGTIIEAELDRGRGVIATVLVDQGTLKMGDAIVAGGSHGRIRAMFDDRGNRVNTAEPAKPVVILGLSTVPNAGDRIEVAKDERAARQLAESRVADARTEKLASRRPVTLEDLQKQLSAGGLKELNLIVKADIQGSVEAIRSSLEKIEHPEVGVKFISLGVGAVGDSDVLLASASKAIIVAFNVKVDPAAARLSEVEHVEIREYRVIYDLFDDVKKAMAGLLDPIYEENALGTAEVRAVFKLPKSGGVIAGSYILTGKVVRGSSVRIRRGGKLVAEGKIDTLKREKDDAREVAQGFECGILIPGYDPAEGDLIECYEMKRIERTLS
jgi:translation initiation factor IF-2